LTDARTVIGDGLNSKMTPEQVAFLMDEVLAITKRAHGEFNCKKCGQRQKQPCDIPDANAVTIGITRLADQSWGRPQETTAESGLTVSYKVELLPG
jgi:hypothetical protein